MWSRLVRRFERIGDDPEDSVEIRLQKRVLVAVSVLVGGLAVIWGAIYLAYDEPRAALIPWVYAAAVSVSLAVYAVTHRYRWFRFTQLFLILVLPFLLQLALGGFVNAS
ncbi:MAG TPA: hypothetical protein VFZ15_05550, partial [Acidimicrobiia bacterium]|nr:hypothetical protein [Acidimicrobiia bacterium]